MKRVIALIGCLSVVAAVPVMGTVAGNAAAASAPAKTIVQIAAADPDFSTLVKLLKEAGLVGVLSGKTDYTVFAPTNAAFAKLPASTLSALAANRAELKSVLLYHVVPGTVAAAKVVTLHSVKTVEGASLTIRVSGSAVYVNQAKVIHTNIRASNGIIHVINGVLTPPSM